MCGIAGYIGKRKFNNKLLNQISSSMDHRGPDAKKFVEKKMRNNLNIIFFHNRLSIIDLHQRSNQPMEYEENLLSFNGEIYNFHEIQKHLIQSYGLSFNSKSDTEVLLKGLSKKGIQLLNDLDGMWAFAFFDKMTDTIARLKVANKHYETMVDLDEAMKNRNSEVGVMVFDEISRYKELSSNPFFIIDENKLAVYLDKDDSVDDTAFRVCYVYARQLALKLSKTNVTSNEVDLSMLQDELNNIFSEINNLRAIKMANTEAKGQIDKSTELLEGKQTKIKTSLQNLFTELEES